MKPSHCPSLVSLSESAPPSCGAACVALVRDGAVPGSGRKAGSSGPAGGESVTCRVPAVLWERLTMIAGEYGISLEACVMDAVEDYVATLAGKRPLW